MGAQEGDSSCSATRHQLLACLLSPYLKDRGNSAPVMAAGTAPTLEKALAAEEATTAAGEDEEVAELDDEMQAAIAGKVEGSPLADEDEEEEGDVAAHLKESIEGSLKMKRMLEDDEGKAENKKAKTSPEMALITKLLIKFQLPDCMVTKYVLTEICDLEELKFLDNTNYNPDKFHWQKSAPDLLARYINDCRERKGAGGGPLDCVSTFKFRYKLDAMKDKLLRGLNHKDLRYVLSNFDGSKELEEVIKDAKAYEPEEESTETALPDGAGVSTIGRFGRLELIDPLADAAVFGDANLTFALKLARHRKALVHVGRVIATTFEDLDTLRERYKEIDDSIHTLEEHFSEVHHSVDCTRIAVDDRFKGMEGSLGAVYYNYPHSGAIGGFF